MKNKNSLFRSRHMPDDSSDEEDEPHHTKQRVIEKEEHIGKVVCVENTEAKKKTSKENWFPALVVAPTAQDTVRIRVKEEYLVRSFKDGRYYTVPKKEATEFTREKTTKQDSDAVQAAIEYLDNDSLPPHWDRDSLFGTGNCSSDFDNEYDSDSSDDEPREEKDHFVAQLYKYMDDRGTPLNKGPSIVNKDVDLYRLFRAVQKLGGYNRVTSQSQWKQIATRLGYTPTTTSIQNLVKQAYKKFLLPFEEFDRKLGCTMVAHPRANRIKGRSLVRANSVASPRPDQKEGKPSTSTVVNDESENTNESSTEMKSKRKLSTGSGKVKALVDKFEEKAKEEKEIKKEEEVKETKEVKETRETKKIREMKEKDKEPKSLKVEKEVEPATSTRTTAKNVVKEESTPPAPVKKEKNTKKPPQQPPEEKKGKKKKELADAEKAEKMEKEKIDLANDFPIEVGDKLKVYYHEQKVTYEAKVVEISVQQGNPLYYVHYTGWNTRYDEWVPKERIAENLTNNKTNKRAKTGPANKLEFKINEPHSIAGPTTKPTIKRIRGTSRGDSQPPRSTTPSSVASNSSRTKSPATPAQRRTTRGQPGSIRRTSNNTDISSIQTDTDSDSDEPVKKPPVRKTPLPRSVQQIPAPPVERKATTSNPSSEEETVLAKGRDYDLNQIRSELKGFKELKSPTPEDGDGETNSDEKKFNFPSTISNAESSDSVSQDISKTVTSDSAKSSDTSSESDSFGDDDSQFSDKTTTLENISEKLQEKFKAGKLDTDVFKRTPLLSAPTVTSATIISTPPPPPPPLSSLLSPTSSSSSSSSNELVNKMATLKASGIEKIIKNSLADKSKALPEKMTMKTLCERSPLKQQQDREKEKLKEEPMFSEKPSTSMKILSAPKLQPKSEPPATLASGLIEKNIPAISQEPPPSPICKPTFISSLKPVIMEKPSIISKEKPLLDSAEESIPKPGTSNLEHKVQSAPCDVYEFKEPEPFEYEAPKKLSPDIDKKTKKKPMLELADTKITAVPPTPKRLKKSSPVKDSEKMKIIKSEEEIYSPMVSPTTLIPPKQESIFDSLRKSPSFNLNLATQSIQEEMVGLSLYREEKIQQEILPPVIPKPTFISSFVEALPAEEIKKVEKPLEKLDSPEKEVIFETAKKILNSEDVFEAEQSKTDKASIADKVLKVLTQQNQSTDEPTPTPSALQKQQPSPAPVEEIKPDIEKNVVEKTLPILPQPIDIKPLIISVDNQPQAIPEPPKIELPAIIKRDIETPPKKPVLNSPEHKLDILESIAPKNNDLSETIQKLESVIQTCPEINQISEDSSDSTDSEQRLVIEDESLSSEAQNEFNMSSSSEKKDDTVGMYDENRKEFNVIPKKEFNNEMDSLPFVPNFQSGFFGVQQPKIIAETTSIKTAVDLASAYGSGQLTAATMKVDMFGIKDTIIQSDIQIKSEEKPDSSTHNESLSLLLCEETIPGSPAPPCAKDTPETKKEYDNIFASPHPSGADIKSVPMDIEINEVKIKHEHASPNSSPHGSLSHDDSSEEIRKQGNYYFKLEQKFPILILFRTSFIFIFHF